MDKLTAQCMKVIRGQKHDFLNHLQVIFGLLQLGKSDKALQYVKKTIATVRAKGVTTVLEDRDLAFYLTLLAQEAAQFAVDWQVELEEGAAGLLLPESTTTALYSLLWAVLEQLGEVTKQGQKAAVTVQLPAAGKEKRKLVVTVVPAVLQEEKCPELEVLNGRVQKQESRVQLVVSV
ncbi:MAG: Spo0B domain-containing protein [Thermoanaerobacteraceae bacterium]|nr:Spo0B domain-containing protein [Thermoanaerobacteraceae bacterium]